jgi:predicted PurR-regulated permease PerM
LPLNVSKYIYENEKKVIDTLFVWLKWQLILWISMFFITLIWLLILKIFWINIPNIFTLALIAWFMEFIPYIWTIVSFFLAITLSLTVWWKAIVWVIILYLIIQQIEWNILVPFVMGKTLSLSPFSVLIFMLIWWALFWIIWMIFTIPIICTVQIFIKPYLDKRFKENTFLK